MNALAEIWMAMGGETGALRRVSVTGDAHALPSAFHVTELAAGAVGAATLAAARLRELADGKAHKVAIDRRHATLSFRSERHFRVNGSLPSPAWDAASGYYETACGGLLQAHCNFAHHRAGVLAELDIHDPGDGAIRAAMEAAIRLRGAADLEDALTRRGMVAAMLRTPEQWAAHPHARATANLPLIEIERLGDAPAEPLPATPSALGGIRVADLTRVIAGPVCGRTLAAYGADVLRIGADHLPVVEGIIGDTNLGKRWANVDLRERTGVATLRELIATGDVVVQGYRPGCFEERGLGASQLANLRPGVVVASLSAYSHTGPWATKRGFDSLVQTATGIGVAGARAAGRHGRADTLPLPAQALDHGTGWLLAAGVMEALRRRATIGGSWHVRTSLLQVRNFLESLGRADALDVPDPGGAVSDLLATTPGAVAVEHLSLPGCIDGERANWSRAGSQTPADAPQWLPSPSSDS